MSSWGYPHENKGICKLKKDLCKPRVNGCVLSGRYIFSSPPEKIVSNDVIPQRIHRWKNHL